jgi:alkaline phosphatase
MARDEPLLSDNRASSDASSDDHSAEEEDALLTGQYISQKKYGWAFWREVGVFVWALAATVAIIVLAVMLQHRRTTQPKESDGLEAPRPSGKRNLIFMVSDGMGPASLSLTRSYRQFTDTLPMDDVLVLDGHHIGSSRTRSNSSLVTDSAAGATAFSCGFKSYNGAISMLPDHTPCGTVLEAAKLAGYTTGLVVTTRITDATPACFAAHVNQRGEEDTIARHMVGDHPLGHVVDLMLGGGRCHFLPNTTEGSCRGDEEDIVKMAKDKDYTYISTREEFDNLKLGSAVKLPLLGLFAPTDIPYEIDRRTQNDIYPSLDEMARTALKALSEATRDTDKGFFLMVEGSRIDHAGHGNDPVAQVHEVLAYDKAFNSVLEFLDNDDVEGIAVSTSDHETGGLATARQLHSSYPQYLWYPGALANASHSGEYLAHDLRKFRESESGPAVTEHVQKLLKEGLGVHDASDAEVESLAKDESEMGNAYTFADIISRRAQNGWSTHGHSAVDVNIYASDPSRASALIGNHENTEVGNFLRDYLDLDLKPVTDKLNKALDTFRTSGESGSEMPWTGKPLKDDVNLELNHYDGDFKKRNADCGCGMRH